MLSGQFRVAVVMAAIFPLFAGLAGAAGHCTFPTSPPGFEIRKAEVKAERSTAVPFPLTIAAHCQVEGIATPGPDSEIRFEVWLPVEHWNGKLLVTGNGGYSGALSYGEMAAALARGYAVAGGNTGHEGDGLSFGMGHKEKIRDWGDRSIHEVAVAAKAIVEAYEGNAPTYSYFKGCSTGGGQGLTEAQRYPDDFDGIIAGAPGNNRTHLNMGFLWMGIQNLKSTEGRLSPDNFKMISRAVLEQCDGKDGLRDNVIADPRRCSFKPSSLLCRGGKASSCLSGPQVKTLETMMQGPRNPRTGEQIYPPFTLGSEWGWAMLANGPELYRAQFWSGWVFNKADWTWKEFDWDNDVEEADAKLAGILNATNPDLSAFRAHDGKLILFQGWADPIVSALDTVKYYQAVEREAGGQAERFTRLFVVPGMGHCGGGFDLMPSDSGKDLLSLLEAWREQSEPPKDLLVEEKKSGQVLRTRIACPYPAAAVWNERGNPDKASNFRCLRDKGGRPN